jgi:hypothetical protein
VRANQAEENARRFLMNEIKEILEAIQDDGISDERLDKIREIHGVLGLLLDSVQSTNGLTGPVSRMVLSYLEEHQKKTV